MRRSAFDSSRDVRIADEADDGRIDPTLLCTAYGCPNLWAVDAGLGRLCSAHSRVGDRSRWPEVTQQQQWADVERARLRSSAVPTPPVPATAERVREIVGRMGKAMQAMTQRNGEASKAWALALKAREEAGEKLTLAQREAWRAALGPAKAPRLAEEDRL